MQSIYIYSYVVQYGSWIINAKITILKKSGHNNFAYKPKLAENKGMMTLSRLYLI